MEQVLLQPIDRLYLSIARNPGAVAIAPTVRLAPEVHAANPSSCVTPSADSGPARRVRHYAQQSRVAALSRSTRSRCRRVHQNTTVVPRTTMRAPPAIIAPRRTRTVPAITRRPRTRPNVPPDTRPSQSNMPTSPRRVTWSITAWSRSRSRMRVPIARSPANSRSSEQAKSGCANTKCRRQHPVGSGRLTPVDDDGAALHHPPHAVHHGVDVRCGIAVDGYDVGEVARRHAADAVGEADDLGAVHRRRPERVERRHAGLHQGPELARVLAEHHLHGVGAHREFHAGLDGAARGLEVARAIRVQAARLLV